MNHLVELLLGFLVLFLALQGSEESQPYSWAVHVCSSAKYETAYKSYRTYRTRYKDYYTKCGFLGWSRCKRTRSWRSYYYATRTTSVQMTYYHCCSGWRQNGRYCSIPICSRGCGHGRCTSPNTCSCKRGWKGSRCQYGSHYLLVQADYSNLVPTPTVTHRLDDSLSNVQMVCSFDFPAWNNVSYLVEWYANSIKPVKNDTWCIPWEGTRNHSKCTRRQSVITLSRHFVIGDTVWCKLYIKFSKIFKNNWTETGRESNQFYVGIQISPRHAIINCKIRKNVTVTLRPTVPILAPFGLIGTDSVVVSILIPREKKVSVDKCSVELRTEDIIRGKTITVSEICEEREGRNTNTSLFHFKPETALPDWFSGVYEMPSMKVTSFNTENVKSVYETCGIAISQSSGEVEEAMITFDSRLLRWNYSGFFVLHSNEAKKVQVHIRIIQRNDRIYSVCGAAIRERENVIVFSVCDDILFGKLKPSNLRFTKRSPGKLSKGIHVELLKGSPLAYMVLLSSGIAIGVGQGNGLGALKFSILTPASYKGQVSGLCGNYNDVPTDDFRQGRDGIVVHNKKNFIKSWRISEEKSFFKALPPQEETERQMGQFCFCFMKNQVQTKEDCQTVETHFAKLDENERRLMIQTFHLTGGSSDCKYNSSFCQDADGV